MNQASVESGGGLIAQYEELRTHAVSPTAGLRQSLGYVLFIRRGIVAWASASHRYATQPEPATPTPAVITRVSPDLRGQLTLVLAGIIFNLQTQEVCRC